MIKIQKGYNHIRCLIYNFSEKLNSSYRSNLCTTCLSWGPDEWKLRFLFQWLKSQKAKKSEMNQYCFLPKQYSQNQEINIFWVRNTAKVVKVQFLVGRVAFSRHFPPENGDFAAGIFVLNRARPRLFWTHKSPGRRASFLLPLYILPGTDFRIQNEQNGVNHGTSTCKQNFKTR